MQYDRKVTYIDELPELDDLGTYSSQQNNMYGGEGLSMIPNDVAEKYQKVIRNSHMPSAESGMFYHQNPQEPQQQQLEVQRHIPSQYNNSQQSHHMNYEKYQPSYDSQIRTYSQIPQSKPYLQYNDQIMESPIRENFSSSVSCLDFAGHVKGCPICSKFYNTDKTAYIIAIVILSIVCLLLLRKVLNM
jgi:hypothetical protein